MQAFPSEYLQAQEAFKKELKAFKKNRRLGSLLHQSTKQIAITSFEDRAVYAKPNALNQLDLWDLNNSKLVYCFKDTHTKRISAVAATPDAKFLLSGSEDNTIAVWSLEDPCLVHKFEEAHEGPIIALVVTKNSKFAVSASLDRSIAIWDLTSKKLVHRFDSAHADDIWTIAVSADNEFIVSAGEDHHISVWSISKQKLHYRFLYAHTNTICSVAVTPDCKYIVSGSADGTVGIWDLKSNAFVDSVENTSLSAVKAVAVSEDSSTLYYGCEDGGVSVWKLFSPKANIRSFEDNKAQICSLIASPYNKNEIITSTVEGKVITWELDGGARHKYKEFCHFWEEYNLSDCCVTPNFKYCCLLDFNSRIFVWSLEEKKIVHVFRNLEEKGTLTSVASTPDSKYILACSNTGSIAVWSLDTFEFVESIKLPTNYGFSTYAKIVLTGDGERIIFSSEKETEIFILSFREKKVITTIKMPGVCKISLSKDSRYLVATNQAVLVWDLVEMKLVRQYELTVQNCEFLSNNMLMISKDDGIISFWDINKEQEEPLQTFKIDAYQFCVAVIGDRFFYRGDEGELNVINYKNLSKSSEVQPNDQDKVVFATSLNHMNFIRASSDEKYLVSPTYNGIEVWNTSTLALEHSGNVSSSNLFRWSLALIGEDQVVCATMDGGMELWNLKDNKSIHKFENAQPGSIRALAVSEDSRYIVSGCTEGTIAIWDFETKKLDHIIKDAHKSQVLGLGISCDTTKIVSLTRKEISVWKLSTRELVYSLKINEGDRDSFLSIALSVRSPTIVIGTMFGNLKVFNIDENKEVFAIKAHEFRISCVALTMDEKYIISGSSFYSDRSVAVWNFKTKSLLHRFNLPNQDHPTSVVVDPEGKSLFVSSNNGSLSVFDLQSFKMIYCEEKYHKSAIECSSLTPDGKYLVTLGHNSPMGLRKIKEDFITTRIPIDAEWWNSNFTMSKDNSLLIVSSEKRIVLYDFYQKKKLHSFEDAGTIKEFCLTDDSKFFVTVSEGESSPVISFWNLEERNLYHRVSVTEKGNLCIKLAAFPDCKTVAWSLTDNKSIKIFDIVKKQVIYQIDEAHKERIGSLTAARDGVHLISFGDEGTIAVWQRQGNGFQLLRRFKYPMFSSSCGFIGVTRDSTHIIASDRQSIQIWKLDQDENEPPLELTKKDDYLSSLFLSENTRYLAATHNGRLYIWDLSSKTCVCNVEAPFWTMQLIAFSPDQRHILGKDLELQSGILAVNASFLPSDPQIQESRVLTLRAIDCYLNPTNYPSQDLEDSLKILAKYYYLPKGWNFLHFVASLLPNVDLFMVDIAKKQNVALYLDTSDKTPLHYMMEYAGDRTMQLQQFFSYFFKNIKSFINLNVLDNKKLLYSLSLLLEQTFETQTESSFVSYLINGFFLKPEETLKNSQKLPVQGELTSGTSKAYIPIKTLEINEEDTADVVSRQGKMTLNYSIIGIPLTYDLHSEDSLRFVQILNESPNVFFYEFPIVQHLIDIFWGKAKKYFWWWLLFNLIPVVLFTAFALLRTDNDDIASELLGGTIAFNAIFLIFEFLQIKSNFDYYSEDPFNFIELVIILVHFVTAGLYWGNANTDVVSFFVSLSLLLWYTKILILLRVIDQLRQLIRMIIEIVTGSLSFMTVIFTYIIAFTTAMYQSRNASGTDDLTLWGVALEMYTFGIGSYDDTNYSGVTMPFFIIATILMPLILLNMLIALMGDIYGKANEDAVAINAKEKIAMISEISSTVIQLSKLWSFVTRRGAADTQQQYFMLIVEPYEANEGSETVEKLIEKQSAEIQSLKEQLDSGLKTLKSDMKKEFQLSLESSLEVMENKLQTKFQASFKTEFDQMSALVKKALKIEN